MLTVKFANEDRSGHLNALVAEAKKRGYAITFTPTHVDVEVPTVSEILALGIAVGKRLQRRRP